MSINEKDKLINEIIQIEFAMFDKVEGIDGRACCQDDYKTFYIMRYSQHNAFSETTLKSYVSDLYNAKREGRNIITEKYGYMMEETEPEYFLQAIKNHIPPVANEKIEMIKDLNSTLMKMTIEATNKYPRIMQVCRHPSNNAAAVSILTYLTGEFKTYSIETLTLCLEDVKTAEKLMANIVLDIQKTTMAFYGFKSLEEAEKRIEGKQII